jgi:hypothetical protein
MNEFFLGFDIRSRAGSSLAYRGVDETEWFQPIGYDAVKLFTQGSLDGSNRYDWDKLDSLINFSKTLNLSGPYDFILITVVVDASTPYNRLDLANFRLNEPLDKHSLESWRFEGYDLVNMYFNSYLCTLAEKADPLFQTQDEAIECLQQLPTINEDETYFVMKVYTLAH